MNERPSAVNQNDLFDAATTLSRNTAASSELVNRTHRVVRERALTMQQQKSRVRSLWFPLVISFGFLASLLYALWNMLDESEFFPDGIPDASQQMMLLLLWCLPVSAIVLAAVWFRRGSQNPSSGRAR